MRAWHSEGVPKEKLILGLAFYGRSFKLHNGFESCPITETPVISGGTPGDYTREPGFLAYYEVCEKLQKRNWGYVWNEEQQVPYAYSNEASSPKQLEWIGFDDVRSIEVKLKFLMQEGLGGAMIWSMDMDDFNGDSCKQDKYPLLNTINSYLKQNSRNKIPDPSVNWKVNPASLINQTIEALHPKIRNEKEFIESYNRVKLDDYSFFRTFSVFHLMKNNSKKNFLDNLNLKI